MKIGQEAAVTPINIVLETKREAIAFQNVLMRTTLETAEEREVINFILNWLLNEAKL